MKFGSYINYKKIRRDAISDKYLDHTLTMKKIRRDTISDKYFDEIFFDLIQNGTKLGHEEFFAFNIWRNCLLLMYVSAQRRPMSQDIVIPFFENLSFLGLNEKLYIVYYNHEPYCHFFHLGILSPSSV